MTDQERSGLEVIVQADRFDVDQLVKALKLLERNNVHLTSPSSGMKIYPEAVIAAIQDCEKAFTGHIIENRSRGIANSRVHSGGENSKILYEKLKRVTNACGIRDALINKYGFQLKEPSLVSKISSRLSKVFFGK
ncbi:MAG: hypothetical protein ACOZAN_02930 [Patescibacteria group bacterium]